MKYRALLLAMLLVAVGVASSRAADGLAPPDSMSANRYVRTSLLLEAPELNPGSSTMLGVAFDLDPEWHLYWRNPGDSGLPPTVTFDTPPGIEIGEPLWPAPERMLAPGDILDYVYDGQLTLLFPMRVLPDVTGPTITITAAIEFLACRDLCIPGKQQVSATWPVRRARELSAAVVITDAPAEVMDDADTGEADTGERSDDHAGSEDESNAKARTERGDAAHGAPERTGGKSGANAADAATQTQTSREDRDARIDRAAIAARFATARVRLPRPAPAGAVLSRWTGTALELHVQGAKELTFFPYESDQWIYPVGISTTGTAQGDRLQLTWPEEVKGLASVQGVLEVLRGERTDFLELKLAVPR